MEDLKLLRPRMEQLPVEQADEPDLLREMFPYDEVPKIMFDGVSIPLDLPAEPVITDTTFRDGQQARPPYTPQQILALYDMLHRLGGPKGIIRQSEFFLYSDKDRQAVEMCLERGYEAPEVTGWIRAVKADFQLVKRMGLKETGILTSASDYHIYMKLGWTRQKAVDNYVDMARTALETCDRVRCHLEDVTRADIYGFIVPLVQRLMDVAREAKKPVKIRLCDTMGYGLPWAEAALPRSVPKLCHAMIHEAGVPKEWLEWHGHNDFHKVLANATAAWLYGCAAANGTILGFGERTGNPPIEGLVMDYAGLLGTANGMDTTVITEIADYCRKELGFQIPSNEPFIGSAFNVTAAGIHADGLIKNEEIYNIFNTAKILNRPMGINVNDKSGVAGVAFWVDQNLGLSGGRRIDKHHPGIRKIFEWVEAQYAEGRTTTISNEEMMKVAREYLPEYFK